LVLTLGVVDTARVFSSWVSLTNGVREGALFASTDPKYTYWCMKPGTASTGFVPCPSTAGTGNYSPDPDNIAYRIEVEATGLDASNIVVSAPACTTSAGVVAACTSPTAEQVTVTASYRMSMLTPVIGAILGNSIQMTSSATAPIFR